MDNVEAPPISTTSGNSFFTPLLISMVGIVSSSMIIVTYHLIVTRYCRRRRQQQQETMAEPRWVPERRFLTGVEEKVLETIPIIVYSAKICLDDQSECAVCLGEFEDAEMVRVLPSCKHAFHVPCIDQWFIGHASCPVCRSPIVAISTKSEPVAIPPPSCVVDHDRTVVDDHDRMNMQSCALLRHCVSLVLPRDRRPRPLVTGLKRSLSMDQTSIIIDIERNCGNVSSSISSSSSSSSSSSLKGDLTRSESSKHFDRVPTKLWRPFSRSNLGRQSSGILPY